MTGRDNALTIGYLFSYMQLAANALVKKSLTNSSRMSMASASMAPTCRAFFLTNSRSWRSCPTSPVTAMTSRPFSSMSHLMQTDVSRPPEYASTTLSFSISILPSFRVSRVYFFSSSWFTSI